MSCHPNNYHIHKFSPRNTHTHTLARSPPNSLTYWLTVHYRNRFLSVRIMCHAFCNYSRSEHRMNYIYSRKSRMLFTHAHDLFCTLTRNGYHSVHFPFFLHHLCVSMLKPELWLEFYYRIRDFSTVPCNHLSFSVNTDTLLLRKHNTYSGWIFILVLLFC